MLVAQMFQAHIRLGIIRQKFKWIPIWDIHFILQILRKYLQTFQPWYFWPSWRQYQSDVKMITRIPMAILMWLGRRSPKLPIRKVPRRGGNESNAAGTTLFWGSEHRRQNGLRTLLVPGYSTSRTWLTLWKSEMNPKMRC